MDDDGVISIFKIKLVNNSLEAVLLCKSTVKRKTTIYTEEQKGLDWKTFKKCLNSSEKVI